MNRGFWFLCFVFILLVFPAASHLKAQDSFHYAVYAQTFSETRIVDGQATSTRSRDPGGLTAIIDKVAGPAVDGGFVDKNFSVDRGKQYEGQSN